ncbi:MULTISPECIES: hypothetical protein [unclassified Clostridium]|uniref:hypothetical protein n=1 Tax=unclassified Clostridium TaxID=2614128 RepID=UPI0025B9AAF2|nr:hypothetical protein [Clostridium sp.]MCI6693015.1 hypothetical protein [Clostridium sp.]MDY2630218.1 hypothetical protein [Clostridium sp.]MDY4251779.1 hypothetical protein [Clostridium sp.]MDY6228384.1 hypothetical protein [Clostridium sp.]
MEIKKSRIYELWNIDHSKVIRYKQIIKNNTLNESIELESENLNELMKEVRVQINKWNGLF